MKISDAVAQAKANGHRITENNSNDEFTKSEFYIRIGQDVLNHCLLYTSDAADE